MIELVMVIILIGILAAVVLPNFIDLGASADDAASEGVVGGLKSAVTIYYASTAVGGSASYPANPFAQLSQSPSYKTTDTASCAVLATGQWGVINVEGKEMKNGELLTVHLSDVAFQVLKDKSKVRRIDNSLVFFNRNGNTFGGSWVSSQFKKSSLEAGIEDFRFHDLRHDFCSRLVQRGVDLYVVSRLAGHKNIKETLKICPPCT